MIYLNFRHLFTGAFFCYFKKNSKRFQKSVAFSKKNWYIKCVQMVCKYEPVPVVVGVPKRRKL